MRHFIIYVSYVKISLLCNVQW